jgi:hypothetical protein
VQLQNFAPRELSLPLLDEAGTATGATLHLRLVYANFDAWRRDTAAHRGALASSLEQRPALQARPATATTSTSSSSSSNTTSASASASTSNTPSADDVHGGGGADGGRAQNAG